MTFPIVSILMVGDHGRYVQHFSPLATINVSEATFPTQLCNPWHSSVSDIFSRVVVCVVSIRPRSPFSPTLENAAI